MKSILEHYGDWARREHSPRRRSLTLIPLGVIFLATLPVLLVLASRSLDRRLRLPRFRPRWAAGLIGGSLAVLGMVFGLWSNAVQFEVGRGTPLPVMPTRRLVVRPPYTYCRNPMTLGAFLIYSGVAVGIGSLSGVGLVVAFLALLMAYIKLIEEKELSARFGEEYLEYKRVTPFFLPRLRRRR